MSIRDSIIRLVGRHNLDEAESAAAMNEIMSGVATPSQIAAFLTALHFKGETAAEIAGGVYESLLTSAAALTVAIPAFVAHSYISARVNDVLHDIERASIEILEVIQEPSDPAA